MSDMDLPLAVRMMQDGYLMEIDALQTENEKLRELVQRLYGSYYIEYPDSAEREFAGELRELGVEV